jgi:uncharacterized membrane protein
LVGAAFLLISFCFQTAALLIPQGIALPQWLPHGAWLFLLALAPMCLIAWVLVVFRIAQIKRQLPLLQKEEDARIAQLDAERQGKQ